MISGVHCETQQGWYRGVLRLQLRPWELQAFCFNQGGENA